MWINELIHGNGQWLQNCHCHVFHAPNKNTFDYHIAWSHFHCLYIVSFYAATVLYSFSFISYYFVSYHQYLWHFNHKLHQQINTAALRWQVSNDYVHTINFDVINYSRSLQLTEFCALSWGSSGFVVIIISILSRLFLCFWPNILHNSIWISV